MKRYIEATLGVLLVASAAAVEMLSFPPEAAALLPKPGQTPLPKAGLALSEAPCWLVQPRRATLPMSGQREQAVQLKGKIETPLGVRFVLEIDGEQLSAGLGETVRGIKVVEQTEGGVILESGGRRVTVSLRSEEGR
jgi:hypothetical protein